MQKLRGRPFQPGNKYGRGRPKGSRNKITQAWDELQEQYGEAVFRKCFAMALQGDRLALRLCIERLVAIRRDATVDLKLPSTRTVEGVDKASDTLLQAISRGELTPEQGESLTAILDRRCRIIEVAEFEERLKKLEEARTPRPGNGDR